MYWDKMFNVFSFLSSLLFVMLFIGLTLMDRGAYKETMEDFPVSSRPEETDYVTPASE